MINTLTLNPSVDYIVEIDEVKLGGLNRTKAETKLPGGKGINVSRVLHSFGVTSKAIGFIGGFTGRYVENYLNSEHIDTDFIEVNEDTRINIKLKSDIETEINGLGPNIATNHFEALIQKIKSLNKDDFLILAGSIPTTMPNTIYEELVRICNEVGCEFVVDAEGELLKKVLPFNPFLIKPNHHELGQFFDTKITSVEDAIHYGRKLNGLGAKNVIVSLAEKGAVFINGDSTYIASVPKGEVKSSVGAGDSMVAGFLAEFLNSKNSLDAFKFSVAAGSATAFSIGLCTREKAESLLSQVKIEHASLERGEVK